MNSTIVHLHKARDAEDSWALNVVGDISGVWRAEKGFGGTFEKVWSLELQSREAPDLRAVDWDAVLERAIIACDLSDPLIADFQWPVKQHV